MSTPADAASGGILSHDQFQAAMKAARERFFLIRKKHPGLKGHELIRQLQSDEMVDRELTPQTRASIRIVLGSLSSFTS
jgi:hypothetical protein